MRYWVAGLVTGCVAVCALPAWPVCRVPQPRSVCAEYSNSEAVVVAKLEQISAVERDGLIDSHTYTLRVSARLRGETAEVLRVFERNDSGRVSFNWVVGKDYLLFLDQDVEGGAWSVDGCGNSGPAQSAKAALAAVKQLRKGGTDAEVSGMVSTGSWATGIAGVEVTAASYGKTFTVVTGSDGRFSLTLPPGEYEISAERRGRQFPPNPFSYEDPAKVLLSGGGCAQVEFSEDTGG